MSCPSTPAVILSVSGIQQTPKATGNALYKQKIVFTFCCGSACCVPGMLLMGVTLRNIPHVTDWVFIDIKWSASLRNVALAIILSRAGLGLDPTVRYRRCFKWIRLLCPQVLETLLPNGNRHWVVINQFCETNLNSKYKNVCQLLAKTLSLSFNWWFKFAFLLAFPSLMKWSHNVHLVSMTLIFTLS